MKKKFIFISIFLIVVSCIGILIFIITCKSKPFYKLNIGIESSLLSAPVWIAENNGYFKEEQLNIIIKEFDSGKMSFINMLEKNKVVISTVAPTPIVFKSFERNDFSILASFVYSYDDVKIIASLDKEIKSASDLQGKKIGLTFGTTGQFVAETFLIENEISVSDVEFIDISPSGLPDAIKDNLVDAIVTWEPHANNAKKLLKDKVVRISTNDIYKETFNFVVLNDLYKTNPDILVKFLKAIDKAIIFMNNNKEESQTIVCKKLDIEKENILEFWDDFNFQIYLDQSLISVMEDEARWLIRKKITDKKSVPNYLNYIYPDALKIVKPESVHIYTETDN